MIHVNIILLALFHVLSVHLLLGEAACCVSDLSLSFQVLWDCHLGLYFSGTNQYCYHYYHVFFPAGVKTPILLGMSPLIFFPMFFFPFL